MDGGEFGLGKNNTLNIFKAFVNNLSDKYQLVAIAGKNKKMQDKFSELVGVNNNVKIYGYSNNIPELMSISDLVVTKPGGLTVTESLVSNLPIVIINPIPGQEVENAEFLERKGIAVWIKNTIDLDKTISDLLNNSNKLKSMSDNAKLFAKRNSTSDICKLIIENKL